MQALRYEEIRPTAARVQSGLKEFLLDKAMKVESIAHSMHWHIQLERLNQDNSEEMRTYFQEIYDELMDDLEE